MLSFTVKNVFENDCTEQIFLLKKLPVKLLQLEWMGFTILVAVEKTIKFVTRNAIVLYARGLQKGDSEGDSDQQMFENSINFKESWELIPNLCICKRVTFQFSTSRNPLQ